MYWVFTFLVGLNAAMYLGDDEIQEAALKVSAFLGFVMIGAVLFFAVSIATLIQKTECAFGSQTACYAHSYEDTKRIEGATKEQIADLIAHHSMARAHDLHKWNILRDEWYKDELVTTRQMCVLDYLHSPYNERDVPCFDRKVITGKHAGDILPEYYSYKLPKNATEAAEKLASMQKMWGRADQ